MDTHAKTQPPIRWLAGFDRRHACLDRMGTIDRFYSTGKLGDEPVAHEFDERASMFCNMRCNHLVDALAQPRQRFHIVGAHRPTIARASEICNQNRRQFAFQKSLPRSGQTRALCKELAATLRDRRVTLQASLGYARHGEGPRLNTAPVPRSRPCRTERPLSPSRPPGPPRDHGCCRPP